MARFWARWCAPESKTSRTLRLFALSALTGLAAGLGACAFHLLLELVQYAALDAGAGFHPPGAAGEKPLFTPVSGETVRWLLVLLPAVGGLLSGLLVFFCAPEAEGHGTDAAIDAYHRKDGLIRARVPLVKMLASALTIGTGGSAGVEGPISQIGAGMGSVLARLTGLSPKERRILLAAGMGAGIGAIFRTPLAGALFAAEVLYREMDFEYEVIAPGIIASVMGYSVFALAFGFQPLFATPGFAFRDPAELIPYALLALLAALGARLFTAIFYKTRDAFRALNIPRPVKPMLGGLLTGLMGFFLPEALSTGYGVVQGAFLGGSGVTSHSFFGLPALALLAFALAKMFTTSASVASGGSGGIFGPAIVIGGALGGAFGLFLHGIFPGWISAPGAFAMVGMAGFFAAAARTPISTVIMVSEMTGNYELLVPSMWVAMLAFLAAQGSPSLYEKQAPSRSDSLPHRGDMLRAVLTRLSVKSALLFSQRNMPRPLPESTPCSRLMAAFDESGSESLAMVDEDGKLTGQLSLKAVLQTAAESDALESGASVRDFSLPPVALSAADTLEAALRKMTDSGRESLFITDSEGRPIGLLSESDIGALCEREIDSAIREESGPGALP